MPGQALSSELSCSVMGNGALSLLKIWDLWAAGPPGARIDWVSFPRSPSGKWQSWNSAPGPTAHFTTPETARRGAGRGRGLSDGHGGNQHPEDVRACMCVYVCVRVCECVSARHTLAWRRTGAQTYLMMNQHTN